MESLADLDSKKLHTNNYYGALEFFVHISTDKEQLP